MEELVVTGSNIPTAADALTVPVTVVGPLQIENSGVSTNILDLLRKTMPQFSGNGNIGNENAQIASNTNYGGSQLALHNLQTLVLVDGQRLAFNPVEGEGGNEFVDLNMIPLAAIGRIEVLNDGASAIYGSDAVGGVVNIILKSDFNGWDAGGRYGFSKRTGSYRERTAYLVGGVSNDKTSVMVAFDYARSDPLYLASRPFSNPIYGTSYYPGIIDVFSLTNFSDQRYKLNPSLNAPPGGGQYTIDQLVAMGVYSPVSSSQVLHGFNLANAETLIQSLKRSSAVINMKHKIFGDSLYFFGDAIYAQTHTLSSLNGQPLPPFISTPYINYANYQAPSANPTYQPPPAGALFIPATAASNPFSTDYLNQGSPNDQSAGNIVTVHNRFLPYPREFKVDSNMFRTLGGLGGKIGDDYSWDLTGVLNRYELAYTNPGLIDTVNFDAAMASGAINPFAITQPAGSLPGNVVGSAFVNGLSTLNIGAFTFRGTPFSLPGGKLGFAVGAQFSRESLSAQPDTNSIPDAIGNIGWANATSLQPFNAKRTITSYFAEIEVPIVGPSMAVPGLYTLSFDVAGRKDDYSRIGSSSVPKASLLYKPFDDQLSFRASASKSFSVPILFDLYGPISTGSTVSLTFNNYGGGQSQLIQFQDVSGANPNLKPSTATTWVAGFVYSPKAIRTLTLSADYYQTVEKKLVGFYDENVVAQSVELLGPASPYAPYVHFGSPTGRPVTAPGQLSTANPSSVYFNTPFVNLAAQAVKGFDGVAEYVIDTSPAGTFDITSAFTVYNSYLVQALPSEDYYQYNGHATGNGPASNGTIPRWRDYTTLEWKNWGWDALIGYTYIPSVTDVGPGGSGASAPVPVDSYQQWDATIAYSFKKTSFAGRWLDGLTLRVGVNNVFDKLPPLAANAFPNTNVDPSTYNGIIGRMYYVGGDYKF